MKSILLCLAMVLSASLSAATSEATQAILPDQQICVKATSNTPVNEVKSLTEEERNEAQNAEKDNPKPEKKKRITAGKIFGWFMATLMATIVVLLLTVRGNE
jgi:hypothetical protein